MTKKLLISLLLVFAMIQATGETKTVEPDQSYQIGRFVLLRHSDGFYSATDMNTWSGKYRTADKAIFELIN